MALDTSDKVGASPASTIPQQSGVATTGVTSSGTASEALLKAVSSAEAAEQPKAEPAAKVSGDTTVSGDVKPPVTPDTPATGVTKPEGSASTADATADALPEARAVALTRNARTQLQTFIGKELGLTNDFGEARPLTPADLPDLKSGYQLVRDLRKDPTSFFFELGNRLGYEFPSDKPPATPDYTMPKASLRSEDGQEAFSAKDMMQAMDVLERKLTDKFTGQLKPIQTAHQTAEEKAAEIDRKAQNTAMAASVMGEARKLQHFKENEQFIAARIRQFPAELRAQLGPVGTLYRAYNEILAEKVYPTLETAAEQRVRDENAKKAAGSAVIHPSGAHGDVKKPRLENVSDLARHMEQMSAAG